MLLSFSIIFRDGNLISTLPGVYSKDWPSSTTSVHLSTVQVFHLPCIPGLPILPLNCFEISIFCTNIVSKSQTSLVHKSWTSLRHWQCSGALTMSIPNTQFAMLDGRKIEKHVCHAITYSVHAHLSLESNPTSERHLSFLYPISVACLHQHLLSPSPSRLKATVLTTHWTPWWTLLYRITPKLEVCTCFNASYFSCSVSTMHANSSSGSKQSQNSVTDFSIPGWILLHMNCRVCRKRRLVMNVYSVPLNNSITIIRQLWHCGDGLSRHRLKERRCTTQSIEV